VGQQVSGGERWYGLRAMASRCTEATSLRARGAEPFVCHTIGFGQARIILRLAAEILPIPSGSRQLVRGPFARSGHGLRPGK
jgi:hypothetical protein